MFKLNEPTELLNAINEEGFYELPELSFKVEPSGNDYKENTVYDLTTTEDKFLELKKHSRVSYKMNNVGHRSEDFLPLSPDKTNILFAGCSITFGEGVPSNYPWPNHVYRMMSKHFDLGPLNILGYPGGTAEKIISNIFKYCALYGNPDYIFVTLPDYSREIRYSHGNFHPFLPYSYREQKFVDDSTNPRVSFYRTQNMYRLLEIFCLANGIKLIGCSWDSSTTYVMEKLNFTTFHKLFFNTDYEDLLKDFIKNTGDKEEEFLIFARDGVHPGLIQNLVHAKSMYDWAVNL
jgi:hypothetical protein